MELESLTSFLLRSNLKLETLNLKRRVMIKNKYDLALASPFARFSLTQTTPPPASRRP